MAGAEAEAKNNWGMVITILDPGGHVVMLQRMDGSLLGSIDVARDKAWSAVAFRRPTKVFEDDRPGRRQSPPAASGRGKPDRGGIP